MRWLRRVSSLGEPRESRGWIDDPLSPFFWSYDFIPELVYARDVQVRGRTDVLSRPRLQVSSSIALHMSSLFVPRSLFLLGRPDVFSWPRLRTTSSSLQESSILLISTSSSRASMVWTDTVSGVLEGGSMDAGCIRALDHKRPAKPPRVSILHVWFFVFLSSSKYREVRIQISGGVWSSQCQTCHRLGDRFLSRPPARRSGSGGALREGRPEDHRLGGRLASSAGVQ